jgi:hypothetical protein
MLPEVPEASKEPEIPKPRRNSLSGLPQLGHDMGNPWVTRPLPAPTPAWNRYPCSRVTGLCGYGYGYLSHITSHQSPL